MFVLDKKFWNNKHVKSTYVTELKEVWVTHKQNLINFFLPTEKTCLVVISSWRDIRKKSCGAFHHQGILNKLLNVNIYWLSCRYSNWRDIKSSLHLNILYLVLKLHQPSYFNFDWPAKEFPLLKLENIIRKQFNCCGITYITNSQSRLTSLQTGGKKMFY